MVLKVRRSKADGICLVSPWETIKPRARTYRQRLPLKSWLNCCQVKVLMTNENLSMGARQSVQIQVKKMPLVGVTKNTE